MSAIHLSAEHIAAIVGSAVRYDSHGSLSRFGEPADIATRLAVENARSVGYRYSEETPPVVIPPGAVARYQFRPLAAAALLKALDSYEYQTCEHPEWEESEAHRYCRSVRNRAIESLPGYEEAAWVIDLERAPESPAPVPTAPTDRRSYGAKYDAGLTTTQVAARFRVDVKEAIRRGELPKGLKLSVRTDYFSGGSSIHVAVLAAPGVRIHNPAFLRDQSVAPWSTPEGRALLDKIKELLDAYNHDGSDLQTDYHDVKFYGCVQVGHDVEAAERAELDAVNNGAAGASNG